MTGRARREQKAHGACCEKLERIDGATRPALANDRQLSQVFLNLIVNAAQAMPAGAADSNVLRVETMDHPDGVAVEISDTGSGIAAEHLPKIFDPFFTTKPVVRAPGWGWPSRSGW